MKAICIKMPMATLFIITKQNKCPSVGESAKNIWED